jgi:outer membrane immunogenic protein
MNRVAISLMAGVASLALIGAAHAADLIIDEPMVGVVETTGGNWEGVFIGGFIGGAGGSLYGEEGDEELEDVSGWLVGVNAGANFYLTDGVVAGVVGDVAWSSISYDEFDADEFGIQWQGSLRGRLGFDAGAFMPYVTGGLAFAGGSVMGNDATHLGWTIGAGVEVAVTENLSIDALYRYSDFGDADYSGSDYGYKTHQATIGLNWKF